LCVINCSNVQGLTGLGQRPGGMLHSAHLAGACSLPRSPSVACVRGRSTYGASGQQSVEVFSQAFSFTSDPVAVLPELTCACAVLQVARDRCEGRRRSEHNRQKKKRSALMCFCGLVLSRIYVVLIAAVPGGGICWGGFLAPQYPALRYIARMSWSAGHAWRRRQRQYDPPTCTTH
jgi:hypothetical protein